VLIRRGHPDDAPAVARLADLDEAPVPPAPLLLGEVAGELWVAVSLLTLDHIADPFRRSAEIADLTMRRARQLRGEPPGATASRRFWPGAPHRLVRRPGTLGASPR
jgi:hypothetical protein